MSYTEEGSELGDWRIIPTFNGFRVERCVEGFGKMLLWVFKGAFHTFANAERAILQETKIGICVYDALGNRKQ